MASEKKKAERAGVAARLAAENLHDINKDSGGDVTMYKVTERTTGHPPEQERPGVIGSVFRAVQGTYEHARDAVVGKSHDAAESTREGDQIASAKAARAKDATVDKAKDTADYTSEKMGEYKDYTVDKAKEAKDKTAEKAKGKSDYTADKGNEARGTIFGALENVTEATRSKLTMPSDIVEQTRAAREHGGTGRTVVEVNVEDTKPGKVATSLKASDQMTGQTFNDVGRVH